ncbi:hypothetical protein Fmac_015687 [Flemingia macrophylla]|uniref:RING-type domain-containing protein n=1 Tax=Flemingia macrophylla TaxID=520843 RepID=A0ABD1MFE9_9FABA
MFSHSILLLLLFSIVKIGESLDEETYEEVKDPPEPKSKWSNQQIGVQPNVVTYNSVVSAHCLLDQMKDAMEVFDLMIRKGCLPDVVTYSSLIHGWCKTKNIYKAMYLLREMLNNGLNPNVVTWNTLIGGFCKAGKPVAEKELFFVMHKHGQLPNLRTCAIILDGLFKCHFHSEAISFFGKLNDALELFSCLPSKGVKINVVIYTTMIKGLCKEGLLDEAEELLMKMEENGCPPNQCTYNVYVQGLLRKYDISRTRKYLQLMKDKGFSADATTTELLIKCFSAKKENSPLQEFLQKLCTPVKKGCNVDSNGRVDHCMPSKHVTSEENRSPSYGRKRGEDIEDSCVQGNDLVSTLDNPVQNSFDNDKSGNGFSGSSNRNRSSVSTCFSGNVSEEEVDDGCLDDWETVADALYANETPRSVVSESPSAPEAAKNPRADFLKRCLSNLSKQCSSPLNSNGHINHKTVPFMWQTIMLQPPQCPICYEDLDLTDSSFLPCLCGFHLCLFCHKRILEADGRCPGCRKLYDHVDGNVGFNIGVKAFHMTRPFSMSTGC